MHDTLEEKSEFGSISQKDGLYPTTLMVHNFHEQRNFKIILVHSKCSTNVSVFIRSKTWAIIWGFH